jgi:FkbM family methyltransferase
VRLQGGVEVTALSGFSEYRGAMRFVSALEYKLFESLSLGEGEIVDVGANIGVVSCMLAAIYRDRRIHAFEPNPSTVTSLMVNIRRNRASNVRLVQKAVGGADGTVLFDAAPVRRGTAAIARAAGGNVIRVPCIALDTYARDEAIEAIAFLKIDVEGYEAAVLDGARDLLESRRIGVIYYEVCPGYAQRTGIQAEAATERLLAYGYEVFALAASGGLTRVSLRDLREVGSANWVAVRP